MKRRRRQHEEEPVELGEVLEPYDQQWKQEYAAYEETPPQYDQNYDETYADEYSDEHEAADIEGRFRIAMGVFDLASILVGIAVILVLVTMLVTLAQWLRSDILHSALLMQSGLQ